MIRKAVFPVAGMGTRFLPATKANPKEMLPVVDKPLIQYAVEEAVAAGIKELIFVTSSTKRALEDHFDSNYELETKLAQQGKDELLAIVRNILPRGVTCAYIRQPEALGLGHAVLCAETIVGDEPFAVLLADDLIDAEKPCLKQMLDVFANEQSSVLAVQQVSRKLTNQYGIIDADNFSKSGAIRGIVEKPAPEVAPSTLGVVGRYILTPAIFKQLHATQQGAGGEIQLTDAIARLIIDEPVYAYQFSGTRYDCGSKLGYLQATIALGKRHPEIGEAFSSWLEATANETLGAC